MRAHAARLFAVLSVFFVVSAAAYAQNVTVGGTVTFSSLDGGADDADHTVNGVFTVNGDLTVNGTINCNDDGAGANSACPMQYVIGGNLVLNAGSQIFAENRIKVGNGGNISFVVGGSATLHGTSGLLAGALISSAKTNGGNPAAGGDITFNVGSVFSQESGSIVSSAANDASAGAISITSAGQASIAGSLLAGPSRTLTSTIYTSAILSGGGGHVVGGAITIRSNSTSEPAVVVSSTGIVASQGSDGGGNTVALQGCNVQVNGLVAAIDHKSPNARVVIRSGTTVTVDGSNLGGVGVHLGKLRGDSYGDDASGNRVDVFAAKDITLLGPASSSGLFVVSANPGDKKDGGTISVISTGGAVTATQNAFAATGANKDQNGGSINVWAKNNVTLNGASLIAAGGTTGSNQGGGHIAVRSYSGALNWQNGVGDVRPAGSASGLAIGFQGTIALGYCTTLSTSATSFPTQGSPVGVFPTTTQSCSPAAPSLPSGETLPACDNPPSANNTSATTNEDNAVTITMTASDPDGDSITFSILTPPAHGNLSAIFNQTPTSAQVTYTPNANYNGGDSFTFQADDGKGGTSTGTVTITINPVNDPPTFNLGANPVSSNEDAGAQSIANYASSISPGPTADEQTQTVTFTVTNDNNALFSSQPAISPSGTLTYTSAPNANGSANISVVAHDSGGTANGGNDTSTTHNFNIVVNAVNDAPSFTPGANVTVLDTDGAYSAGWATSISAGPPDESGQTLNFTVGNDNNALFSAQPAISASGVLTFTTIAGQSGVATVTVQLHDNGGTANGGVDTSAAVTFTITVDKVPVITSANNTTFVVGTFGTFTVTASAHPPADVFESGALPTGVSFVNNGPPSSTGTLSGTPASGTGGVYNITFTATNVRGSSAAQAFTLTVNEAPTVGTNPSDQMVCAGSTASFTASAATGFPAPTVQWQLSTDGGATFNNIAGATSTTYAFTASLSDNGHKFRAVFTNGSGSATTSSAMLTVNAAPAVTTNPAAQTVCAGATATFTAAATAAPAATVQWQVSTDGGTSFSDVSGATSTTYSFTTAAADNGKQYRAVFTNACGSASTSGATLTVDNLPVVTTNPAGQTVCAGATATFTAAATSNASDHTVRWQVSGDGGTTWNDIAGATSTTYSFVASNGDNGKQYRAVFTDACGSTNTSAALLTVDSLPVVTTDPAGQTVCSGAVATFTAAATSNAGDQAVQWQVSTNGGATWSNIPGATSPSLSFTTAPADNGKQYRAVFTDACGSTNTAAAALHVDTLPVVVTNPASQTVCAGATATFTASATSNANDHTVQWQVSTDAGATWNNIAGATSTTLSFTAAPGDNGRQYRAVFTDACGSANSAAAVLTVDTLPVVAAQPSNATVCAGTTATFTSSATSNASDHTVQWQLSTDGGATWNDIVGATSTTYSFATSSSDDGHQYRAVFTDACGSTSSNAATLTVNTAPVVTSSPSNTTVCENTIASFTASASGSPAPAVQWQLSTDGGTTWNNIAGATSTTYSFTANAGDSGNQYRALFTNTCGSSTTSAATLTVNTQPVVTTNPSNTSVQSGATASFTAAASGTPAPTVQWQVSTDGGSTFNDIAGATSTTYSFTAQTADSGKQYRAVFTNACSSATTTAATLTVTCATITVSRNGGGAFPAGTYNTAYSGQSVTASGGSGSYTFAVTAGALPSGLSLSSGGAISGTPTATGTFAFTVTATDTNSSCTGSAAFSIAIQPSAASDAYANLVNNTEAVVTGGSTSSPATPFVVLTGSLLANDQPAGGVTAVPGTFSTTQGGSVTIAADGTFRYTPPVTASPLTTDTFTYTAVSDSGATGSPTASNASVNLSLSNRVWYVNNSAATNGNGQSQSPFNTLASFTSDSRVGPDSAGDIVFVYTGDGTTTNQNAGVALLTNEQLIGNGVALVVNGNSLVAAGTKPQITNPGGAVVTTDSGNTIRGIVATGGNFGILANTRTGLTVDTVTSQNNVIDGLTIATMSGTITVTNTTLTGNKNALNVFTGTGTVNIDNTNTITNSSNTCLSVSSRPAGAGNVTIGATINDTGRMMITTNAGGSISLTGTQTLNTGADDAVTISGNSAPVSFTGTLGITTTIGSGFVASGGTVTVTGANNTVTTGAASNGVSIASTVGAGGVTFKSITTTGATTGLSLSGTGANAFTLTGNATTINAATGVSLSSTGNVSLGNTAVTGCATVCLTGSSFGTLSIGSGVSVSGATALNLSSGTVSGTFSSVSSTGDSNGVSLSGVTGSWGTTGGTLTGASAATFNVTGGGGTITWGGAISQANAGNVVTIAGGNSNTINFNGNVTSSGASAGLSIGASSGSYNFNGTNSFSGSGGILISNGEAGSISFSSNTTNTTTGTSFQVDGSTSAVTAAIAYGGTINKASAGRMIDVNKLNSPGTLTMTHSPAAGGNLTANNVGATGISIINSSSTNVTIANASVTVSSSAAAFTSSANTGTINLQGAAFTANGNKQAMLISGGGTINVTDGAASSAISSSGGTARAIDGTTAAYTGILNLTNAAVTDNAAGGGVFLTSTTLTGTGSSISGAGAGLTLSSVTLAAGAGMTSVSSSGGANGISLTNCTGGSPYTIGGGSLTGNSGSTFVVSGGTALFTYNGTLAQSIAQRIVNISGITAGAITLGGSITGSASSTGITLGGSGGAVAIGGAISLNGTNDTFTASDSGGLTISVTNANNVIGNSSAPTGPALSISNVTIGASNVIFKSVSANGGTNAIVLNSTGASGHLQITGDGTNVNNASGGTMQNQTGDAVSLTSTRGPVFNQVSIQSSTHNGIKGTAVIDFTLTNSTVNASGITTGGTVVGTVDDSNINFGTHAAGSENNLSGVVTITGNTLTNAYYNGIFIYNFAGTIPNAAVSNNIITSSTLATNSQGSGISWIAFGSASGVASITKATVDGNNIQHFPSGGGIAIECGNATSAAAPAGSYGNSADATNVNAIRITNNTITGGTVQMNTNAILATIGGTGSGNFLIDSNGQSGTPLGNVNGAIIGVQIGGTGTLRTTINNNKIVANNIVGSRGISVSETMQFVTTDAPTLLAFVTNNNVSATNGCGIFLENAKSNGTMKATVTGNIVGKETQTVAEGAIQVFSGDSSATTNVHTTVCLTINGNTATGGTNSTATQTAPGIGIRLQADSVPNSDTFDFNINGLGTSNATVAQMESYVGSQNPGSNCGTFGTCNGGGAYGITTVSGYGNTCTGGF